MDKILSIVGPTACGKTKIAVETAYRMGAEIISADSRQVYKGMDIGTGKDLEEYTFKGTAIPYHIIDVVEAGYKYNIFEFQNDFIKAFKTIRENNKPIILCGGSGLYLQSVTDAFELTAVPPNKALQERLKDLSLEELSEILHSYKTPHNTSDTETKRRAIRAIEIADFQKNNPDLKRDFPHFETCMIGLDISRELRREKISKRLKQRLENGMIEEVKRLLEYVKPEDLIYYGLEYKFVTLYVLGELTYKELFEQLEIAIHQFAKRQMTWFRGMERKGTYIHWVNAEREQAVVCDEIIDVYQNFIQK